MCPDGPGPDTTSSWQLCAMVFIYCISWASLVAQIVKNPPALQETWVQSLGQEDPPEEEMGAHSSVLAWRTPWTEEPGGLQSRGSHRVRHYEHTCSGLTALSPVSFTLTILQFSQRFPLSRPGNFTASHLPLVSCSSSSRLLSVPLTSQTLVQLRSFIYIVPSAWHALLLLIIFYSFLKCSFLHESFLQISVELLFALSVCLEYTYVPQSSASFPRQGLCLGPLHICL